jgi:Protein of unknown function (DUF3467)
LAIDPDEARPRLPVEGRSSNYFELAFTASEFLLDFGQAYDSGNEALIHARIIMTPLFAKTLTLMLQNLLEQYEKKVGPIQVRATEQD